MSRLTARRLRVFFCCIALGPGESREFVPRPPTTVPALRASASRLAAPRAGRRAFSASPPPGPRPRPGLGGARELESASRLTIINVNVRFCFRMAQTLTEQIRSSRATPHSPCFSYPTATQLMMGTAVLSTANPALSGGEQSPSHPETRRFGVKHRRRGGGGGSRGLYAALPFLR